MCLMTEDEHGARSCTISWSSPQCADWERKDPLGELEGSWSGVEYRSRKEAGAELVAQPLQMSGVAALGPRWT